MASGGAYVIKDATEAFEFPAPVTDWPEQVLGKGLNNIPALNAYRLHVWRWGDLPEEIHARLVAFQTRQQTNEAQPVSVETDAYDPSTTCEPYRTTEYTDVTIQSVTRERGYGSYRGSSIVFEILAS